MIKKFWFLMLPLAALPAQAAFQADMSGVRSLSLGGAVSASAHGAADLFDTPASLGRTETGEMSLMYGKPFSGIPGEDFGAGAAALAVPSRWGTWGAGIAAFQVQGALQETTFSAAYGASFIGGRVRAGAALKRLEHKYLIAGDASAQADPIFRNNSSRSAWDADLGVTASLFGPLQAGFSVRNLRRADVGIAGRDRLHREVRGGLALNIPAWGVTAAGDLFMRSGSQGSRGSVRPALGVEKGFAGPVPFFLRGGVTQDRFSAGLGLSRGRISLDYALLMPRAMATSDASTHQVQMTFRFGAGDR